MSETNPKARWRGLWHRLGAVGEADPVYEDLLRRYAEPERAYHTLTHIEHCFEEWDAVSDPAVNLDAIEFALWFHDAVYDTRSKNNEEQSAALARDVAGKAGLSESFVDLVTRLILATKHASPPETLDEAVLVDVDLSILGQDAPTFDEYERQIRQEYAWVPEDAFAKGRAAILSGVVARPRIYTTELFHKRYETRARANLTRSIAKLEGS